ncbi:hypothetical protein E3N88_29910 [Mikania micrantha]|uniref:DYW domain-containing protein n=1 Tax=Mikania micrantha TaxID=192012 RepID=A0A5N6MM99_9ASTR|nr:hypothetical protein E3N88_29910 [Mikania micrantha]
MHRRSRTPFHLLNAFPKTQFISLFNNSHQFYKKNLLVSSYFTSLQINLPAAESNAPIKRKNGPSKWDKERLRWFSGKLRDCAEHRLVDEGKTIHKQIMESEFGKQLHGEIVKAGFFSDGHVGSALVDLYAKCGELEYAEKVCLFLPEHNAVSWNSLLNGFALAGNDQRVLRVFCRMKETEMKFNKYTLCTVLKGCASSGNLKAGQLVHSMAIVSGCVDEEFLSCSLVDMYSKCGLADDALKVFWKLKSPDNVTWSAMICCLEQQGREEKAAELFSMMISLGLKPNQFTLTSIVSAAKELGDLCYSQSLHGCVHKYGFANETLVNNALITMYMKNGSFDDGYKIFNTMSHRDLVSWNALLAGFHEDKTYDGLRIFQKILENGFKPNIFTYISTLRSCSSCLNTEIGKQVHAQVIKEDLDSDCYVGTALIDMYVKSKCINDGEKIINRLNEIDLFTWTTIISGCAQTDQGEKSIFYFKQMQKDGVKPNEFTLAGCLRGCSGITSLKNGRQLHSFVVKDGHVDDPYVASALVDMYGKCGCIKDAEMKFKEIQSHDTVLWNTIINHFINQMKLTPNNLIWETLLGACKVHKNVELGQRVAEKLFQIEPEVDSNYIMLSNIFAANGMWDDVARVRALMSSQGIKKEPGCSWVEVNGQTHVFLSQDASHLRILEIHQKLEELEQKLLSIGYVPNTDYVLHNVSDVEKREILSHHSERLALSFSLINNNSNKTVTIFKNLRICGDCHKVPAHAKIIGEQEALLYGLCVRKAPPKELKNFVMVVEEAMDEVSRTWLLMCNGKLLLRWRYHETRAAYMMILWSLVMKDSDMRLKMIVEVGVVGGGHRCLQRR